MISKQKERVKKLEDDNKFEMYLKKRDIQIIFFSILIGLAFSILIGLATNYITKYEIDKIMLLIVTSIISLLIIGYFRGILAFLEKIRTLIGFVSICFGFIWIIETNKSILIFESHFLAIPLILIGILLMFYE
ncbi:MAG: hypothetical protein PHU63_01350 [Candidatus ainarchaeum sp.]|nr:hypothetical protein [Candidatus ainarchaeum sp.]